MCGIAGWILDEKPSTEFVLMLMSNMETRGHQSFGFYNGELNSVSRHVGAITDTLKASDLQFAHGFFHTRHATTGDIIADNSHPFEVSDIIGAHNGMVYNHKELNLKFNRTCEVDSEHIFFHIKDGLPMSDLDGYGAIEYVQSGRYYIAACNDGELVCAMLENGIVWASTKDAIESACFQSGYIIKHYYQIDEEIVYEVRKSGLFTTDKTFKLAYNKPLTGNIDWRQFLDPMEDTISSNSVNTSITKLKDRLKDRDKLQEEFDRAWKRDNDSREICDWCGEYETCNSLPDSTLVCKNCEREMNSLDFSPEDIGLETVEGMTKHGRIN